MPGLVTADMVKPGAAVLDVGVSRTADGLRGDVAAGVAEVAGFLSPNPGGVGPLTRAFLLTNVVERAEHVAAVLPAEWFDPAGRQFARRICRCARSSSSSSWPSCSCLRIGGARGAFVFGVATLFAAVFRLIMPSERVGLLAVRNKPFDVGALWPVGVAIVWLAASIDPLGTD